MIVFWSINKEGPSYSRPATSGKIICWSDNSSCWCFPVSGLDPVTAVGRKQAASFTNWAISPDNRGSLKQWIRGGDLRRHSAISERDASHTVHGQWERRCCGLKYSAAHYCRSPWGDQDAGGLSFLRRSYHTLQSTLPPKLIWLKYENHPFPNSHFLFFW